MTDRDALLAAIRKHPDEDVPRLAFADWCDEHGQPERGEFVRVQCELARNPRPENDSPIPFQYACEKCGKQFDSRETRRLPKCPWCQSDHCRKWRVFDAANPEHWKLENRERELFKSPAVGQFLPRELDTLLTLGTPELFGGNKISARLRRGFVDAVALSGERWVKQADTITEHQPVVEVALTTMPSLNDSRDHARRTIAWNLIGRSEVHVGSMQQWEDTRDREGFRRTIVANLLSREWPRIAFTLPPEPQRQNEIMATAVERIETGDLLQWAGRNYVRLWGRLATGVEESAPIGLAVNTANPGESVRVMQRGDESGAGRIPTTDDVYADYIARLREETLNAIVGNYAFSPGFTTTYQTTQPISWNADPATATPIADLRRFQEEMRSRSETSEEIERRMTEDRRRHFENVDRQLRSGEMPVEYAARVLDAPHFGLSDMRAAFRTRYITQAVIDRIQRETGIEPPETPR